LCGTGTDEGAAAHWPETLRVSAAAEGSRVRLLRRRLAQWLCGDHLDDEVIDDLVMAASEALENCCDHAFGFHGATDQQKPDHSGRHGGLEHRRSSEEGVADTEQHEQPDRKG
jgi:hypothetical protein